MAANDQQGKTSQHLGAQPASENPEDLEARQAERWHVFAVNHDPEFMDVVRVLRQEERYNVTTTNYLPRTCQQIAALQPSLLLIDLLSSVGQAGSCWSSCMQRA